MAAVHPLGAPLLDQSLESGKPNAQRDSVEHEDVEETNVLSLFCAWSIGFLTAIEGTVSLPSLWLYVKSLGGTKEHYSFCIAAFPIGRLCFMGIFGMWTDRRPYKEVFQLSLLISMSSGVLYASGPTLGLWAVVVARGVLGAMSCQSVATQSFVSMNTSKADRTKYMSINNVVSSSLSICGPAFNAIIVMLPSFELPFFVFNSYTWVGWFLFSCQLVCMMFIHFCFTEPATRRPANSRKQEPVPCINTCLTLGGFFPWGRLFVDQWLRVTGAWVCFVLNFRNQFTSFAVTWIIPIITDRDYGFGQLQNSMIFLGLALESLAASCLVGYMSSTWNDRDSLTFFQSISFAGLLAYCILSGLGNLAIPLPLFIVVLVWYDFGAPASQTQSLYSKLIGPGSQAIYFSVLQSNGAMGRILSAYATRLALVHYGMPCLWITVFTLWGGQWIVFFAKWTSLHPDSIDKMQAELAETPIGIANALAKGKGKGKGKRKNEGNGDEKSPASLISAKSTS